MGEVKLTAEVGKSLQLSERPLSDNLATNDIKPIYLFPSTVCAANSYEITVYRVFKILGKFSSLFYLHFCRSETSNGFIFGRLFFSLPNTFAARALKMAVHCT